MSNESAAARGGETSTLEARLRATQDELAATSDILAILAASSAPEDVFAAIVDHAKVL